MLPASYTLLMGKVMPSVVALRRVLERDDEKAKAVKSAFHRTVLWRLVNEKRAPDLTTATTIEQLTDGEVSASGWVEAKDVPEVA